MNSRQQTEQQDTAFSSPSPSEVAEKKGFGGNGSGGLPFRLRLHLHEKLEARLEAVPLFNVLLIAVLLAMTGAHYIFSPGISIALGDGENENGASLPTGGVPAAASAFPRASIALPGVETSSVLTVKSDSMFILDGRIYENLKDAFASLFKGEEDTPGCGGGVPADRGALLVKIDRAVSVQGLFKIAELAGEAGFSSLQIAGESPAVQPEKVR